MPMLCFNRFLSGSFFFLLAAGCCDPLLSHSGTFPMSGVLSCHLGQGAGLSDCLCRRSEHSLCALSRLKVLVSRVKAYPNRACASDFHCSEESMRNSLRWRFISLTVSVFSPMFCAWVRQNIMGERPGRVGLPISWQRQTERTREKQRTREEARAWKTEHLWESEKKREKDGQEGMEDKVYHSRACTQGTTSCS
jgi:hypothetical protein